MPGSRSTLPRHLQQVIETLPHDEVRVNPHAPLAEVEALRWVQRFRLARGDEALERFKRIKCGAFAGHTYPHAPPEKVILGAELIGWLFLFDDQYGEGQEAITMARVFDSCMETLRTGQPPLLEPLPFHGALADLNARFSALGQPLWQRLFAQSMGAYFSGCLFELPYRQSGLCPTLDAYIRLRTWSIGALPVFDLILLEMNPLPLPLRAPLIAFREHCAQLTAWVNDLHSYTKETASHDPLNLVAVLQQERQLLLEDAFLAAVDLYRQGLATMSDLARSIQASPHCTPQEKTLVQGTIDWVHGNTAWTRLSGRYYPQGHQES
ncbi:terpene synthase family protein [Pseudomonas gingeri]|uniref:Terpene synthase n=2 Tax=Pseudomonas gingeri TaxID=117681 RepID=A0A7Y7XYC4_9PSED|nr:hypothetical protein [Pseudomonas gingeri]NWC13643.1 hypothetical protein [Pseudomonas gingeri]